jgi:multidrug efflux pump subunit AcrA (membrane-fusion protein)
LYGFEKRVGLIDDDAPNGTFQIVACVDSIPSTMVLHCMRQMLRAAVQTWVSVACASFCALCSGRAAPPAPGDQVAAYGRLSPGQGAVTLAVPYYLNLPPVVAELFVKVGDHVVRHQQLAVTHCRSLAISDLALAKAHLSTAEERLRALTAEPKSEETAAQEAMIESLQAEVRAEKAKKPPDTAAAKSEARAREDAAAAKVTMGQHQLQAMREVRPVDLAVAQAEVEEAKAAVARAEVLLAFTDVDAPFDGEILKILSYSGADAATRGLLVIGATQAMVIKAEFNVADARRVKVGARAIIKSEAWPGEISGIVSQIDPLVERSTLASLSTFANVDREIIEATITPEAPEKLAGLTGAEVTVTIVTDPATK